LGVPVTISADHQMQMMLAATVRRSDAMLFCSLTGRNAELTRAAHVAAQYNATTLALTNDSTPLSQAVTIPIAVRLGDPKEILFPTAMRYGFLAVIDVLSYLVAQRKGRLAQETMRRIKQQFVTYRDEDDTAPLCD
jgi:DNA-binding MurR/RpiR family transcriptional regulator